MLSFGISYKIHISLSAESPKHSTYNYLFFLGVKVQGRDRLHVRYLAEQLGLDGSYVPRTYIEQIQLEKLVNDVMVLLFLLNMKIVDLFIILIW